MKRGLLIILIVLLFSSCSQASSSKMSFQTAVNCKDYSVYYKKIWIASNPENYIYPSFFISNILDNTIIGGITTDGNYALPQCYSSSFENNIFITLTGKINNDGIAECVFNYGESGNKGIIDISFHNDYLEATIKYDHIEYPEFNYFEGTYLLKEYNFSDIDDSLEMKKEIPIKLNSWGNVNIITGYTIDNHPKAVMYITDENYNILYMFNKFVNGIPIKNINIQDYNNDGLLDIYLKLDTDDPTIAYTYIQKNDGLFYDSRIDVSNISE